MLDVFGSDRVDPGHRQFTPVALHRAATMSLLGVRKFVNDTASHHLIAHRSNIPPHQYSLARAHCQSSGPTLPPPGSRTTVQSIWTNCADRLVLRDTPLCQDQQSVHETPNWYDLTRTQHGVAVGL